MAAWLSSKLKVAEQLLQQIDQQAAESLRKPGHHPPPSLQQQFDRERAGSAWNSNEQDAWPQHPQRKSAGLRKPVPPPFITRSEQPAPAPAPASASASARQEQDWTQLLSSPATTSAPAASTPFASSVGSCEPGSVIRRSGTTPTSKLVQVSSLKQIAAQSSRSRQPVNSSKVHKNGKSFRDESVKRRLDLDVDVDVEDACSRVEGGLFAEEKGSVGFGPVLVAEEVVRVEGNGVVRDEEGGWKAVSGEESRAEGGEDLLDAALRRSTDPALQQEEDYHGFVDLELECCGAEPAGEVGRQELDIFPSPQIGTGKLVEEKEEEDSGMESGTAGDSESDGSESGSDSEYEDAVRRRGGEKRRLRKERELEELAVEAARIAIREREKLVRELESEKEVLERALAEGVEQQVKEAAELQLSMMEVAQALELERHQHGVCRMEGLAREARLEAGNADLTRALASAQRDLEEQLSRVLEISSRVEAKRAACAELERKMSSFHYRQRQKTLSQQVDLASPDEFQNGLREQQLELSWKIQQRHGEVKELEGKISSILDTVGRSTDAEVELQARLHQLTDQLIQKQAQVESLATEKATLVFRLETITNNLRDEKSAALSRATRRSSKGSLCLESDDLESGPSRNSYRSSKGKGVEQVSGPSCLSIFYHIDLLFLGGARILRRHGAVRAIAGTYLLALHGWFFFVLFMKSHQENLSLPLLTTQ